MASTAPRRRLFACFRSPYWEMQSRLLDLGSMVSPSVDPALHMGPPLTPSQRREGYPISEDVSSACVRRTPGKVNVLCTLCGCLRRSQGPTPGFLHFDNCEFRQGTAPPNFIDNAIYIFAMISVYPPVCIYIPAISRLVSWKCCMASAPLETMRDLVLL